MAEDKTKANNFISASRFDCFNNHKPFENSVDINKEIVHNVTSSNKSTNTKAPLIFPTQKNVQKNLLEIKLGHHNTRQYPVLAVTKKIQKNLLETGKLRRTDLTLLRLPLSETP